MQKYPNHSMSLASGRNYLMRMESKKHLGSYLRPPVCISSPLAVGQDHSGAEAGRDHPRSVHEEYTPAEGDSYVVTGYYGNIYTPS